MRETAHRGGYRRAGGWHVEGGRRIRQERSLGRRVHMEGRDTAGEEEAAATCDGRCGDSSTTTRHHASTATRTAPRHLGLVMLSVGGGVSIGRMRVVRVVDIWRR